MFACAIVCGGQVAYFDEFPYRSDMERFIGFMYHRQYIKIGENMNYFDIMKLDRVFDLSVDQRQILKEKLLKAA